MGISDTVVPFRTNTHTDEKELEALKEILDAMG